MKMKLNKTLSLATAMGTLALATSANAASIAIVNHSFEDGDLTGWTNTGVVSLTVTQPVDANYAGSTVGDLPSPADGDFAATLTLGGNYGYIKQNTGVLVEEGLTYTLTVAVGARDDAGLPDITDPASVLVRIGDGDGSPFPATITQTLLLGGAGLVAGGFIDVTASFTAVAADVGKELSILIGASRVGGDTGGTFDFDNVRLTDSTVVPEPSSTALLGLGGLALILRRRK
jgi:hypothetical protein